MKKEKNSPKLNPFLRYCIYFTSLDISNCKVETKNKEKKKGQDFSHNACDKVLQICMLYLGRMSGSSHIQGVLIGVKY
jgi:hypothetical protein